MIELDRAALGQPNLFDLVGRTLRFSPAGSRYRVTNQTLQWEGDLSCTVIHALGDKFGFLAYYSDFRVDSQEASSPSDGPIGGNVTGIGDTRHAQTKPILESRCTGGRFQLGLAQPIFVGANEMQESPPDNAPVANPKNIAFYTRPLAQATPDGRPRPYNYAVGHLGHEIGHRWSAYAAATNATLRELTEYAYQRHPFCGAADSQLTGDRRDRPKNAGDSPSDRACRHLVMAKYV